jgi:hypothetical protein
MLKRTKGRILLTTLVITGLAGTLKNTALTSQERKFAVSQLRESKTDLQKSINGLSTTQLDFRSSSDNWTIKEHLDLIAFAEKTLWNKLEAVLKKPATPENRQVVNLSDEDVLNAVNGDANFIRYATSIYPAGVDWRGYWDAASFFKSSRAKHLKFIKTTTTDLRNRFIYTPMGWIDCYQFILFMTAYSEGHIRQIRLILADPQFPAR